MNPYEAPQTTELQPADNEPDRYLLQTDAEQAVSPLPATVRRWMQAAIAVYILSFIVPLAPWSDSHVGWEIGYGLILFVWGLFYCWHPLFFAWWANLFFFLSLWKTKRQRSGAALTFGLIAILAASSFVFLFNEHGKERLGRGEMPYILPYFCWFAAMILQSVAAWKLRNFTAESALDGANKTEEHLLS